MGICEIGRGAEAWGFKQGWQGDGATPPVQLVLGHIEQRAVVAGPGHIAGGIRDRLLEQLLAAGQVLHTQGELLPTSGVLAPRQQPADAGRGRGRGGRRQESGQCRPQMAGRFDVCVLNCSVSEADSKARHRCRGSGSCKLTCGLATPRSRPPCRRCASWPPRSHPAEPPLQQVGAGG